MVQCFCDICDYKDKYEDYRKVVVCRYMKTEEYMKLMINDLMKSHLSTVEIADKYCDCASPELRDSLIINQKNLDVYITIKKY